MKGNKTKIYLQTNSQPSGIIVETNSLTLLGTITFFKCLQLSKRLSPILSMFFGNVNDSILHLPKQQSPMVFNVLGIVIIFVEHLMNAYVLIS